MDADISGFSMLELNVLWTLHTSPNHGYGVLKLLNSNVRRKMTPGTLYPILKKFKKLNLIELKETVKIGEKARKIYAVTTQGEKMLELASNEFVSNFRDMLDFFHCNMCAIPHGVRTEWKDKAALHQISTQKNPVQ